MPARQAKDRIIETARATFLARGFARVTMDDLARSMGISKKTLYAHFRTKDELLDAAVEWQFMDIRRRFDEAYRHPGDFIDRLYRICSTIADTLSSISREFMFDVKERRPDLWARVEAFRRENIHGYFMRMVEEGARLGVVRPEVDKEVFILAYLGAIQGVINPEVLMAHSFSPEKAFRGIVDVVFEGILSDRARPLYGKRFGKIPKKGRKR